MVFFALRIRVKGCFNFLQIDFFRTIHLTKFYYDYFTSINLFVCQLYIIGHLLENEQYYLRKHTVKQRASKAYGFKPRPSLFMHKLAGTLRGEIISKHKLNYSLFSILARKIHFIVTLYRDTVYNRILHTFMRECVHTYLYAYYLCVHV